MTEFRLYPTGDRSQPAARGSFDDGFAAEQWARSWAADSGWGEEYDVEAADCSYSARLFRTAGGQWYIMRR